MVRMRCWSRRSGVCVPFSQGLRRFVRPNGEGAPSGIHATNVVGGSRGPGAAGTKILAGPRLRACTLPSVMRPKRKRFESFEIPSSQGPVRIEIAEGSVCIFYPEGESYYDGWATADDIASGLVRWARLAPQDAKRVAAEALRRWEDSGSDDDARMI
jgi:hypothetical protein